MLAAQCAYISLVARLWSEFANVVAPPASQSATMRVASLPGAPASSRSQGPAELVAGLLAGGAVDGVPLSLDPLMSWGSGFESDFGVFSGCEQRVSAGLSSFSCALR